MTPIDFESDVRNSLTDEQSILARCRTGDKAAFDALTRLYLKPVYNYLYRLGGRSDWAEEATQETFIKVFRFFYQYQTEKPFRPWLFTIASNVGKTMLKQEKRQYTLDNALQSEAESEMAQAGTALNEQLETMTDSNREAQIQNALQDLPEPVRKALLLRHVYDLSYEEVATALSANLNTVRTWLRRGRDTLQQKLSTLEESV